MSMDNHVEGIAKHIMVFTPGVGYDNLVRWEIEALDWFALAVQTYLDENQLVIISKEDIIEKEA